MTHLNKEVFFLPENVVLGHDAQQRNNADF